MLVIAAVRPGLSGPEKWMSTAWVRAPDDIPGYNYTGIGSALATASDAQLPRLKPSLSSGNPSRLNAVGRTQLANGFRQVVSNCPFGKMQFFRDIKRGLPFSGSPQNLPLPLGKRIGAAV